MVLHQAEFEKKSADLFPVGDRIRELRKSLKLRQADLAGIIGMSVSHLSDIERGALIPTIPTLQKIGVALERPLEYFLNDDVSQPRALGMVVHRTVIGEKAAEKFAQVVAEKTSGDVTVQMYQHAAPKTLYQQVQGLAAGSIHIILDDLLSFEHYAPLCGVAFLPYFFTDQAHYHRFLQSAIFHEHIYKKLLTRGIRLLNPMRGWESDTFELLFATYPVFTPDDLVGRNFRTYESQPANALREALSTIPVHTHWKESHQAFQAGLIDLFLSPTAYVSGLNLHEVTNYTTVIDYGYTQNLVMAISEREYRKQPPAVQQILSEALQEAGDYYGQTIKQQAQFSLDRLSDEYGMPVIHPDPKIWRERFKDALYQACVGQGFLSQTMYDQLQQI